MTTPGEGPSHEAAPPDLLARHRVPLAVVGRHGAAGGPLGVRGRGPLGVGPRGPRLRGGGEGLVAAAGRRGAVGVAEGDVNLGGRSFVIEPL